MLYLTTAHIQQLGTDWDKLIDVIQNVVHLIEQKKITQPTKPYLRFGNPKNRIIAMPAYVGGVNSCAGIKWIASFPNNILNSLPRASSVTIMNSVDTGVPVCIINSSLVSSIRTASVTGLLIRDYVKRRKGEKLIIGITGFGPIGKMHFRMVEALLQDSIKNIFLFELVKVDTTSIESSFPNRIKICNSWEECYREADIFITCTVSEHRYIDKPPKQGSLQLNISLRDYTSEAMKYMDVIVVDDWVEVCRENTDIETLNKAGLLQMDDVCTIPDYLSGRLKNNYSRQPTIMFNPMGMAVFDIAIGEYFYRQAIKQNVGLLLSD